MFRVMPDARKPFQLTPPAAGPKPVASVSLALQANGQWDVTITESTADRPLTEADRNRAAKAFEVAWRNLKRQRSQARFEAAEKASQRLTVINPAEPAHA